MKQMSAYRIAWIVVACLLSEAAFLVTQIILTVVSQPSKYSLPDLLQPENPLYQVPPHFLVVGLVFIIAVLYGEFNRIKTPLYYVVCSVVAAFVFHFSLWFSNVEVTTSDFLINMLAAIIAGLAYWAISPRRDH